MSTALRVIAEASQGYAIMATPSLRFETTDDDQSLQ